MVNPNTRTQIAAIVTMLAVAVKVIFKLELPQEIKDNVVEVALAIIALLAYFLRDGIKKAENAANGK